MNRYLGQTSDLNFCSIMMLIRTKKKEILEICPANSASPPKYWRFGPQWKFWKRSRSDNAYHWQLLPNSPGHVFESVKRLSEVANAEPCTSRPLIPVGLCQSWGLTEESISRVCRWMVQFFTFSLIGRVRASGNAAPTSTVDVQGRWLVLLVC